LNYYAYALNNPIAYVDPNGNIRFSFRSLFNNTYNAISNYSGLIKDSFNAYRANANYQAIEKTRQYYNEYNNLSGRDKQSYLYSSREGYAQTQRGIEFSENAVLGMMGGEGLKVGTSFGKVGTVIENQSGKITGFLRENNNLHGLNQAINRGVDPKTLLETVKNPLVRLKQARNNILYLTKQAAVVLNKAGQVVTTYTKNEFKPHIQEIINLLK
jgi:hypothetical protein